MATENELLALRDAVTSAEYAVQLADERAADARAALGAAKDAYLSAALRPTERPAAGFTSTHPGTPTPAAGAGILPCCGHPQQ